MTDIAPQNTAERLAAMLNMKLFIGLRDLRDPEKLEALLPSHLDWMVDAERDGVLFASGPFVAEGMAPGHAGGLSIVRADSKEKAEAILAQDPFIKQGVFGCEVREWRLMEGGFSVTVHFSDQRAELS